MKTSESIKKQASALSEQEVKTLQTVGEEIRMCLEHKQINEELLTKLNNIITSLSCLKENLMWRVIRAAKQNHMLD
jgi:ABC-type phosphate transport system auxiliary subunit